MAALLPTAPSAGWLKTAVIGSELERSCTFTAGADMAEQELWSASTLLLPSICTFTQLSSSCQPCCQAYRLLILHTATAKCRKGHYRFWLVSKRVHSSSNHVSLSYAKRTPSSVLCFVLAYGNALQHCALAQLRFVPILPMQCAHDSA